MNITSLGKIIQKSLALTLILVIILGIMPLSALATYETPPPDDISEPRPPIDEPLDEEAPDDESPEDELLQPEADYSTDSGSEDSHNEVSAGVEHTVAIRTDESIWALSNNNAGQVGKFIAPIEPLVAGSIPISTRAELEAIRDNLGGSFHLTNDINVNGIWTPIGSTQNQFTGTFDGRGHKIHGITNIRSGNPIGVFSVTQGATIRNLGIVMADGASVTNGNSFVGLLAGRSITSEFHNTYVIGSINYTDPSAFAGIQISSITSGLLIGQADDSIISSSYSEGSITINARSMLGSGTVRVGGLVGRSTSDIKNNYSMVNVHGSVTGAVTASAFVGGLVGSQETKAVSHCYSVGSVVSIVRSVTDMGNFGGLVGLITNGVVVDSFYNSEASGKSDTGKGSGRTTEEMRERALYSNWNFNTIWNINSNTNNGFPFLRQVHQSGNDDTIDSWVTITRDG